MSKDLFQNLHWINKTQSLQVLHPPAAAAAATAAATAATAAATAVANPAQKRARKRLRKDRPTRYWTQLIVVLIWLVRLVVDVYNLKLVLVISLGKFLSHTFSLPFLCRTGPSWSGGRGPSEKAPPGETGESFLSDYSSDEQRPSQHQWLWRDQRRWLCHGDGPGVCGLQVCRIECVCRLNVRGYTLRPLCSSLSQTNDGDDGKPVGGVPGVSQSVPPGLSQAPGDG